MKRTLAMILAAVVSLFALAGSINATQNSGSNRGNSPAQTLPADVLRLQDVIDEALAKNPAVQAGLHIVAAQRAKVPQAKALPDPNFGIGWMGNIQPFSVQTGDPSSYRSISAMQRLPYPGKLSLRGRIASKEADASQWDLEATRRRITADIKAAYYDYWYYNKALQTTLRNHDLLMKLSQVSEARFRVGKAAQADVLRSQVEISMLLQKLTVLEQQKATAEARLNTFMARDPSSPLPPPAEIPTQTPLKYSLEELYQLARQNDTEYQRIQQVVERNQLAVNLAEKDYRPDLTVAYMYQQRPAMPDMHGFTLTVNVPVFYKNKQHEEVRQAEEEALSTKRARDNRQNELYFDLKQNYLAAKASDTLLKLFAQGVVPQSSLALESSMSAYQVGTVDFLTVLGNFTAVLNYETDYYRELANYQTVLARMEALTGADLSTPSEPGAEEPNVPEIPQSVPNPSAPAAPQPK